MHYDNVNNMAEQHRADAITATLSLYNDPTKKSFWHIVSQKKSKQR